MTCVARSTHVRVHVRLRQIDDYCQERTVSGCKYERGFTQDRIFRVVVTIARRIDHGAAEQENYREPSMKRKLSEHDRANLGLKSSEIEDRAHVDLESDASHSVVRTSLLYYDNGNRLYVISPAPKRRRLLLRRNYLLGAPPT